MTFAHVLQGRYTSYDKIEWRNEFFELCDGERKKIKANATKQPDFMRRN